jgi:hypothetical protein
MQYLIHMRLASSGRPTTSADGITFIERFILTPLTTCAGRALALRPRLEQLKADVQRAAGESAG